MFRKLHNLFFLLFFLSSKNLIAQITVNFPVSRAVFQRDNQNNGFVQVNGFVDFNVDRIEGRLVPIYEGEGALTDWQLIEDNLFAAAFSGKVAGIGGWYNLEIRAIQNGEPVYFRIIEKVGIGEVFIISGQSNAQGFLRFNPIGAIDDRVNAYGYYKEDQLIKNPPIADFVHLNRETNVGPHGQGAWAWGELGEKLVSSLKVPVMFFNTAFEGTTIENWDSSSKGIPTTLDGFGVTFPNNGPYTFLKYILQNHGNLYGFRSIIWIQGESDLNTNEEVYYTKLKNLIEISRKDSGKDISWMITRTSRNLYSVHDQIINAQNRVISDVENVFAGPNTDLIQPQRIDGVHLSNLNGTYGISELADRLFESLDLNFFNKSKPFQGYDFLKISTNCDYSNTLNLSISKSNVASVNWDSSISLATLKVSGGIHYAIVRDSIGNFFYTAKLNAVNYIPKVTPTISPVNGSSLCVGPEGGSIEFMANQVGGLRVKWPDGTIADKYSVTQNTGVSAYFINQSGCLSPKSNTIEARFLPKPAKPTIVTSNGIYAVCKDQNLKLSIKDFAGTLVNWSNGMSAKEIEVIPSTGNQTYTANITDSYGCISEESESVFINVYDREIAPDIIQYGPYSLKSTSIENIEKFEWYFDGNLLPENDYKINAEQDGSYQLKVFKRYESGKLLCRSNFSGIYIYQKSENNNGLVIFPNPVKDFRFSITSNKLIPSAKLTIYNSVGNSLVVKSLSNILLPQEIILKNGISAGRYFLKIDYDGFTEVFPIIFE